MWSVRLAVALLWSSAGLASATGGDNPGRMQAVREIDMASAHLGGLARAAVSGSVEAFMPLQSTRDRIASNVAALAADSAIAPEVSAKIKTAWAALSADISTLVNAKEAMLKALDSVANSIAQGGPLNAQIDQVVNALIGKNAGAAQVYFVSRETLMIQRMSRRLTPMLAGSADAETAAMGFSRDMRMFNLTLESLIDGNPEFGVAAVVEPRAKAILISVRQQWKALDTGLNELALVTSITRPLKETSEELASDSSEIATRAHSLDREAASASDAVAQGLLTHIAAQAERVVSWAELAAGGNADAFKKLETARTDITASVERLLHGGGGAPYQGTSISGAELTKFSTRLTAFSGNVDKIISQKSLLLKAKANASDFSAATALLNRRIDEVATILAGNDAQSAHVHLSVNQMILSDSIVAGVQQIQSGTATARFIDDLRRDSTRYEPALQRLIQYVESHKDGGAPNTVATLHQAHKQWVDLKATLDAMLASATVLRDAWLASDRITDDAATLVSALAKTSD